ncbi:unnamed protein product [Pedinophyceae sp. YPF-701]|nr:unnamed protein product [Pedinophyceae sp. YPF-701]
MTRRAGGVSDTCGPPCRGRRAGTHPPSRRTAQHAARRTWHATPTQRGVFTQHCLFVPYLPVSCGLRSGPCAHRGQAPSSPIVLDRRRAVAGPEPAMASHFFQTLVVYAGLYLLLLLTAVSLATGLYYIAELIEEYTRLTKRVITHAIQAVAVMHVLCWVWDRLPFLPIAVGLGCQALFHRNLKKFPFIELSSPDFAGAAGLVVVDQLLWYKHFAGKGYSLEFLVCFNAVMVWLIPFAFFLSISSNESFLPGGASPYVPPAGSKGEPGGAGLAYTGGAAGGGVGGAGRTVAMRIFKFLIRKKEDILPQAMNSLGLQKRHRV